MTEVSHSAACWAGPYSFGLLGCGVVGFRGAGCLWCLSGDDAL